MREPVHSLNKNNEERHPTLTSHTNTNAPTCKYTHTGIHFNMKTDLFNDVYLLLQNNNKFSIAINKKNPTSGYGFMVYYGSTVVPIVFVMAMLDKDEHWLAHKTKNSLNNFMWEVQKTEFEVAS